MTDKINIEDLTSFNMTDHLTDLDSIVNYWSIINEELEGYEKEAGMDIFSRAAYRFACGGNGEYILTLPLNITTKQQVSNWLHKQRFRHSKKTSIGSIGNCYGSLEVFECASKYYWVIDAPVYDEKYEEIPKNLYDELLKFEATNDRQT